MDTQREKAQALGVDWFTRFAKQIELGFFDAISLRLRDARWWKRHFRRVFMRRLEHVYRGHCNLVHAKKWLYTSRDNVQRRRQQKARNAAVLDMMLMVNELGQEFKLAELVEKSNANPAIRRAELMVRIAGFESVAQDLGHAGEFMTLTCPSRFHRAHRLSGAENSKYDGSTPRDASAYLNRVWARVLAELKRNDIQIYGFRVVEPHHDGCPHWHGLFFMPTEQRDLFRRIVAKHGCRDSHEELGLRYFLRKGERLQHAREVQAALLSRGEAKQSLSKIAARFAVEDEFWSKANWRVSHDVKARVDFKAIDWNCGTAAGYIAKYIAKNIDGKNALGQEIGDDDESLIGESAAATVAYVDAWASLWGIRQFQQIGGPPVSVWHELRREFADKQPDEDSEILRAARAADLGDWGKFVQVMGGVHVKRADRPVQLYKELPMESGEVAKNRYGEPCDKAIRGILCATTGEIRFTRIHEWVLCFDKGGVATPWTGVNNSTNLLDDEKPRPKSAKNPTVAEIVRRVFGPTARAGWAKQRDFMQAALAQDSEVPPAVQRQWREEMSALDESLQLPEWNAERWLGWVQHRADEQQEWVRQAREQANRAKQQSEQTQELRDYLATLRSMGTSAWDASGFGRYAKKVQAALREQSRTPAVRPEKFIKPKQYDSLESVLRDAAALEQKLAAQWVDWLNDF